MALGLIAARFPEYMKDIRRRAAYYLMLEALKCMRSGDQDRARRLLRGLANHGSPIKAFGIALMGSHVSALTEPKHRALASRLRSWLR